MIKLVILDFDDTLSMTEEACFLIESEAVARLGYAQMTREAHLKNWGLPLDQAILERVPGINVNDFLAKVEEVRAEFIKENKADLISNENMQFLDTLKSNGKRLAILTSRSLPESIHLLQKEHALNKKIEKFYHKDNSIFIKPNPRVFEKILKDFGVMPNESIYVGDTVEDGICAKSAGLHFIAVLESGLRKKEDFNSIVVDFFATTLPEAFSYISLH